MFQSISQRKSKYPILGRLLTGNRRVTDHQYEKTCNNFKDVSFDYCYIEFCAAEWGPHGHCLSSSCLWKPLALLILLRGHRWWTYSLVTSSSLSLWGLNRRVVQMCFPKSSNKLRTPSTFLCHFICISYCGQRVFDVEEIIEQFMVYLGQLAKTLFFVYMCDWVESEDTITPVQVYHDCHPTPSLNTPTYSFPFTTIHSTLFFFFPFLGFGRL